MAERKKGLKSLNWKYLNKIHRKDLMTEQIQTSDVQVDLYLFIWTGKELIIV